MFKGCIYCAQSPSNKKYYGYTIDFDRRKRRHLESFKKGHKNYFYDAIRKYGWENFSWKIVESFEFHKKEDLKKTLTTREIYWIAKDKSNNKKFGYNMTAGGDGRLNSPNSKESIEKLKKTLTGRITERRGKNYLSEMIEKHGEKAGKKRYKIWKTKLAESHKKPIIQYNKNGVFIKNWSSIKKAEKETKITGSNICACLKGKRKTAGGFIWKYNF